MAKIPGTEKGRKCKKLGIGNNEHVGEGSGTQKSLNFCIARSQKTKIKAKHPKIIFGQTKQRTVKPSKKASAFGFSSRERKQQLYQATTF